MPQKKVVANFSLITDQEKRIGQFVDNLNGTVTDTRTGLMWMRFAEGQRQQDDQPEAYSFDAAMNLGRKIAGYDDWRLPTVEELEEIVCYSRSNESFLGLRSRSICGGAVFWTSRQLRNCHYWRRCSRRVVRQFFFWKKFLNNFLGKVPGSARSEYKSEPRGNTWREFQACRNRQPAYSA
jgi:hypothetical protein